MEEASNTEAMDLLFWKAAAPVGREVVEILNYRIVAFLSRDGAGEAATGRQQRVCGRSRGVARLYFLSGGLRS